MNMPIEQRTTALPRGFALWSKLQSMMIASFKAWRAQRAERAALEALEALGPEVLDDIGVTIVKPSPGPRSFAASHPYLLATIALAKPPERNEPNY